MIQHSLTSHTVAELVVNHCRFCAGLVERVQTVVIASQQWDLSPNQIAAEYELTETQVNQALAFLAKYTEEIDMAIAAEQTLEAANV